MRYHEFQPHPPLNRFIECFWTLTGESELASSAAQPILPDGCVELILNFGAPFREVRQDGINELQPLNFLVGQMTRPIHITPTANVDLLGIRFHPGGTAPFIRSPMSELTNRILALGSLDRTFEKDLLAAAYRSANLAERINAVERTLTSQVRDHAARLMDLTANAVRHHGNIKIDQLADDAGMSSRQLERRFLQEVGIGPKLFCRILRFQQVFRAVEDNSTSWAAVAVDCGYYDQAHLIRDFQEFAEQTPAVLLAQTDPLTELFTRKHRMSHSSNTHA